MSSPVPAVLMTKMMNRNNSNPPCPSSYGARMAFGVKYKVGLINAENGRGWLSNENGEDDETGCSSSRERGGRQEHRNT